MNRRWIAMALAVVGCCIPAFAQIDVDTAAPNDDPEFLVTNVLLGGGVTASNITYVGGDQQIAFFSDPTPAGVPGLGLSNGIVMNTSEAVSVEIGGPVTGGGGTNGDVDLLNVAQSVPALIGENFIVNSINDLAILEFDFVPMSDTLSFNYVFASDEWNDFINTEYNDAFGFFVSGPGITGTYSSPPAFPNGAVNIALVPNQLNDLPITISSITPTLNNQFYVPNSIPTGAAGQTDHSLASQTEVLTARIAVECGETYHIKMAIGDGSDDFLDSAVFLEGGSFASPGVNLVFESENTLEDNLLTEGCYNGTMTLNLNVPNAEEATIVDLIIGGSATNGVDYNTIPNQLIFPPGVASQVINIEAFADNLVEGDETIEFGIPVCDDTLRFEFVIEDPHEIQLSLTEDQWICEDQLDPVVLVAFAEDGYPPYSYEWSHNGVVVGTEFTLTVSPFDTGTYVCEVTGDCGETTTESVELGLIPSSPTAYFESDFNTNLGLLEEGCEYMRLVIELPEVSATETTWEFELAGSAIEGVDYYEIPHSITIPAGELSGSINIEAIVDGIYEEDENIVFTFPFYDECKDDNTLSLIVGSIAPLNVKVPDDFTICEGDEFDITAEGIGGLEPYNYTWEGSDGEIWSGAQLIDMPRQDITYTLTLTDACGNQAKETISVYVPKYEPLTISTVIDDHYDVCLNDEFLLDVSARGGTGVYDFIWYIDGIEFSHGPMLEIATLGASSYDFDLVVVDECQNQDQRSIHIEVKDCTIPNVFSPNGDGVNDTFYIDLGDIEENIRIDIFNRWGKLVYSSLNYEKCTSSGDENCWNGTNFTTGKVCAEGTYYYVIEVSDGRVIKGHMQLFK